MVEIVYVEGIMKVKTGIFWVVNKNLIADITEIESTADKGFVNYPQSHFEMWDKLKPKGARGDFATHPRGRLLYDVANGKYKLFVDQKISKKTLDQLVKLIAAEAPLEILHDEHYST